MSIREGRDRERDLTTGATLKELSKAAQVMAKTGITIGPKRNRLDKFMKEPYAGHGWFERCMDWWMGVKR